MKGKLLKLDNGFMLTVNQIIYATDKDLLSIKNCQEVSNGYDFDEIDVEIVTKPYTEVSEGFYLAPKREPKLDENNRLILKPIKNV